MARISERTGGDRPPEDACTTCRVCLEELKALEADLPEAIAMESARR